MIIPIGAGKLSRDHLPWLTIAIILINVAAFATIGLEALRGSQKSAAQLEKVASYWIDRPYLDLPPEIIDQAIDTNNPDEVAAILQAAMWKPTAGASAARRLEQKELNEMIKNLLVTTTEDPYRRWGLIPAKVKPTAIVTSMFMHASWGHLLGNMLWLWVTAPFLEKAYGRVFFSIFFLLSGLVAAAVHVGSDLGSEIPLVGASGAIAGLMGAFLIRYSRTKIRFFYSFFFVLNGTFRVAAWILMPLWFALQMASVSVFGNEMGIAFWAHIGGFGFGAALAYTLILVDAENRFLGTATEGPTVTSGLDHPALEEGRRALEIENPRVARQAFQTVLQEHPDLYDANLGFWQSSVMGGSPQEGRDHLIRVIETEIKNDEWDLASSHWHELRTEADDDGPAVLRYRLANLLENQDVQGARDVYANLAEDTENEMLALKAMGRLAELASTDGERRDWLNRRADFEKRRRTPAPATSEHAIGGSATARDHDPQPGLPVAGDSSGTQDARPRVVQPQLVALTATDLVFQTRQNTTTLALSQIQKIVVAAITGPAKPFLLIDLAIRPPAGQRPRVVRILSRGLDPVKITGRTDLKPAEAFRELIRRIAASSGAVVEPPSAVDGTWRRYESLESYENS